MLFFLIIDNVSELSSKSLDHDNEEKKDRWIPRTQAMSLVEKPTEQPNYQRYKTMGAATSPHLAAT